MSDARWGRLKGGKDRPSAGSDANSPQDSDDFILNPILDTKDMTDGRGLEGFPALGHQATGLAATRPSPKDPPGRPKTAARHGSTCSRCRSRCRSFPQLGDVNKIPALS